jgi:hypothetical protein
MENAMEADSHAFNFPALNPNHKNCKIIRLVKYWGLHSVEKDKDSIEVFQVGFRPVTRPT